MKKEDVLMFLILLFSALVVLPLMATLSDAVTLLLHLSRWKVFVGATAGLVGTFLIGLLILED